MEWVTRGRGLGARAVGLLPAMVFSLLMSACGGGSSGGSSQESPDSNTSNLTPRTMAFEVAELSMSVRELEGLADPQSITPVPGFSDHPDIQAAITDDGLTIIVGNLENDARERFTVETSADIRYTVTVTAKNTSAQPIVRQAEALGDIRSAHLLVADDRRLMNTLLEVQYLARDISDAEKQAIKTSAAAALDTSTSQLTDDLAMLEQALADYRAGAITETDLEQRLALAQSALRSMGEAGESLVAEVQDTLSALGLNVPAELEQNHPLVYVAEADRYSRYMTSDFGSFQSDGRFRFHAEYDFLNTVFHFASASTPDRARAYSTAVAKRSAATQASDQGGPVRLIVKRRGVNGDHRYQQMTVPRDQVDAKTAELLNQAEVVSVARDTRTASPEPSVRPVAAYSQQWAGAMNALGIQYNDPLFAQQDYFAPEAPKNTRLGEAHQRLAFADTVRVGIVDGGFVQSPDVTYAEGASLNYGKGADFYNTDLGIECPNLLPGEPKNIHGHWVAQVLGAKRNNGLGIAGAAGNVELVAARSMDCTGVGYLFENAQSIRWLAGDTIDGVPPISRPVDLINLSLGGKSACFEYMQEAVNYARDKGIPVVVSAGNETRDAANYTPGNCDGVITVAATTSEGEVANFSNLGMNVAIAAQGKDMPVLNDAGEAIQVYGTSFAAPVVAGVIASTLSDRPNLTPDDIDSLLASAGKPVVAPYGASPQAGAGILDAMLFLDGAGVARESVPFASALGGDREQYQAALTHSSVTDYLQGRLGENGACALYEVDGETLGNSDTSEPVAVFSVGDGEPLDPAGSTANLIISADGLQKLIVTQGEINAANDATRQLGVAHCDFVSGANCSVKDTVQALDATGISLPEVCQ